MFSKYDVLLTRNKKKERCASHIGFLQDLVGLIASEHSIFAAGISESCPVRTWQGKTVFEV